MIRRTLMRRAYNKGDWQNITNHLSPMEEPYPVEAINYFDE